MEDLEYAIKNFHKPRMSKIAEHLLKESDFLFDYFQPPTFETYMVQIKLPDDSIIAINYFLVEVSSETPFLFLQFHCLLSEFVSPPSDALIRTVLESNNAVELGQFCFDNNQLFFKSVMVDYPEWPLDISLFSFYLRVFRGNLTAHRDALMKLI